MDHGDMVFIAGVVLWCVFEYRKREQLHRERLAYLRLHHELPEASQHPPVLILWTTGGVIVLLSIALVVIGILALRNGLRDAPVYLFVLIPFLILLLALSIALINNINVYRERRKG